MKINKISKLALLFWLSALLCLASLSAGAEYIQVPVAIHISSTISDGDLSLEEIVRIARNNGFKAVIITDRDYLQWEYGLWPLRNLIKTRQAMPSLATYGVERYLQKIAALQKQYSDIVIIPATEAAPFYYWEGSPYAPGFKIKSWHKHMLIIGLDQASDYENLPSVSNKKSLRQPWETADLFLLWPFLLLGLGLISVRKRKYNYTDEQGHALGPYSNFWRILGMTLIFFSILGIINNFPYRHLAFDQYHGDQEVQPYQFLIDYANRHGALTYWAHPEAINISKRNDISIETEYYADNMLPALRYTGFAIFYDGFKKVGTVGGLWDTILQEYCAGQRTAPIWAIASVEYDQGGNLDSRLQNLETVALVRDLNQPAILQALKNGRTYALMGNRKFRLEEFSISDPAGGSQLSMGEEAEFVSQPLFRIKGGYIDGKDQPVKVQLIKGGKSIKTFEVSSPFTINYEDQGNSAGEKTFYRLEIRTADTIIITNPIMVGWR